MRVVVVFRSVLIGACAVAAVVGVGDRGADPDTVQLAITCPAGMVYDRSMELCVPQGMSYDGSFIPAPGCGPGTPTVCRGPWPRTPAPGGIPVQPPAGHYRPGYRY